MNVNFLKKKRENLRFIIILIIMLLFFTPFFSNAIETNELQEKINSRNLDVKKLEEEIKQYQAQIEAIEKDKKSLNSDITTLNISQKKIKADIELTQKKISTKNSEIGQLNSEIKDKETRIDKNKETLSKTINEMNQAEDYSMLEIILSNDNFSDFLDRIESLEKFQLEIRNHIGELEKLKEESLANKEINENKKKELLSYKSDLSDKTQLIEINKKEKKNLLVATKNKESNYQKILDEKLALKEAFEAELTDYESQLKMQIDPSSVPEKAIGILSWPLEKIRITQYFGNTLFASQHAQVYNGAGHNGVDFGASTGTKILAALDGVVEGSGDTDVACPGASYGKWILIRHNNGLSTLYAHLSLIKVALGHRVETGEVIGYSGNTGYSTGPHLHFTTYATQGVKIIRYDFKSCKGKSILMPVGDKRGYLNPFSYLPKI